MNHLPKYLPLALLSALAIGLVAPMASASISGSGFAVKAANDGNPSISSIAGMIRGENAGEEPVEPEPAGPAGVFELILDDGKCATPGVSFTGVAPGTKLISPTGESTLLTEGFNSMEAAAGEKKWTVNGQFAKIGFTDLELSSRANSTQNCLIAVSKWEDTGTKDTSNLFGFASNIRSVVSPPSTVENMSRMFYSARNFSGDLSNWDTSSVTNMGSMFEMARKFTGDLSSWDVSRVQTMSHMFSEASLFDGDISSWTTSNLKNTSYMFSEASLFNRPIGSWTMDGVEDMEGMFSGAASFNRSLENWNVESVQLMNSMFSGAASFNSSIAGWETDSLQGVDGMFKDAVSFNQKVDHLNMAGVASFDSMFAGAASFNQGIGFKGLDGSNLNSIGSMFDGATSFNQPISWNPDYASYTANFLRDAVSFEQDLSNWRLHENSWAGDGAANNIEEFASGAERFLANPALHPYINPRA